MKSALMLIVLLVCGFGGGVLVWKYWPRSSSQMHTLDVRKTTMDKYYNIGIQSILLDNLISENSKQLNGLTLLEASFLDEQGKAGKFNILLDGPILVYKDGFSAPQIWEADTLIKWWTKGKNLSIEMPFSAMGVLNNDDCMQQSKGWYQKHIEYTSLQNRSCQRLIKMFEKAEGSDLADSLITGNLSKLRNQVIPVMSIKI